MEAELTITHCLNQLAGISEDSDGLTRTFLSAAHAQARLRVADWMHEVGLIVYEDSAGNLIGRRDCGNPRAGTLACGSHLDTVRNAGKFDGPLGIVAGILAARRIPALPYHLEIVAFSDEEGVRFQTTYLGSRFYTGLLSANEFSATDRSGLTVKEAIANHHPHFPAPPERHLIGYVEVHIEQGPILEKENLALGVVTSIAGQTRARVFLRGRTGHAGTTPMELRHDALAGAAECIALIETEARKMGGLVATVGELHLQSPASNVIPGSAEFTIDIRDGENEVRLNFARSLFAEIETRMARRQLETRIEIAQATPSVQCSPALVAHLQSIVERLQQKCPALVSGAGHDAVALAEVTDVAMLFVRCREGLSHHPDEFAAPADMEKAVEALTEFIATFPIHE